MKIKKWMQRPAVRAHKNITFTNRNHKKPDLTIDDLDNDRPRYPSKKEEEILTESKKFRVITEKQVSEIMSKDGGVPRETKI